MEDVLTIGLVLKPQGIRGELKIKPFTDSAENFYGLKRIFLDGVEYKILTVRTGPDVVFLGLRGVPDRNAAELLRGKHVQIPRDEAPEIEEGRYYIADILGSEVVTSEGEHLGVLTDVRGAATDIYTIKSGDKEIMFPALKEVILNIDPAGKKITVDKKRFLEVAVL